MPIGQLTDGASKLRGVVCPTFSPKAAQDARWLITRSWRLLYADLRAVSIALLPGPSVSCDAQAGTNLAALHPAHPCEPSMMFGAGTSWLRSATPSL